MIGQLCFMFGIFSILWKNYADFNARLRRVHERISNNNDAMANMVAAIRSQPVLCDDWINSLGETEGFDDLWFEVHPEPKRSKAAGSAAVLPGQQVLPKMMAAASKAKATAVVGVTAGANGALGRPVAHPPAPLQLPPQTKAQPVPKVTGAQPPIAKAPPAIVPAKAIGMPPPPPPQRVVDTADTEVGQDAEEARESYL